MAAAAFTALLSSLAPDVPPLAAQTRRVECSTLATLRLPDVRISDATSVPAAATDAIRASHCRVNGVIGTCV